MKTIESFELAGVTGGQGIITGGPGRVSFLVTAGITVGTQLVRGIVGGGLMAGIAHLGEVAVRGRKTAE